MLPPEVLQAVFEALSRDDLDALMLTNVSFCDIVPRDAAKGPFRYFAELNICGPKRYAFVLPTGNEHLCGDDDDFGRRMRLGRVVKLQ